MAFSLSQRFAMSKWVKTYIPYKHKERYRHQITGRAKHETAFKHPRSRRTATFVSYLLSPTKSCDQSETYQSLCSSTI